MNKQEILEKLNTPALFMDDYLTALDGLKRTELIELANEVDAPILGYYSNTEIKKAIVNAFMLPRCYKAYADMFTYDDMRIFERRINNGSC